MMDYFVVSEERPLFGRKSRKGAKAQSNAKVPLRLCALAPLRDFVFEGRRHEVRKLAARYFQLAIQLVSFSFLRFEARLFVSILYNALIAGF